MILQCSNVCFSIYFRFCFIEISRPKLLLLLFWFQCHPSSISPPLWKLQRLWPRDDFVATQTLYLPLWHKVLFHISIIHPAEKRSTSPFSHICRDVDLAIPGAGSVRFAPLVYVTDVWFSMVVSHIFARILLFPDPPLTGSFHARGWLCLSLR